MTPIGTINLRTGCKIAINTLTLPYGTSPELWKKWGRQQPPCIIASHFTMCVFVWVFERGSLATPFLPSKMKCLFHTAGEILGAPYESVGTLVRQFWYLLVSGSATRMALLLPRRSPRQAPHLRVGGIGRQASTIKAPAGIFNDPCGIVPIDESPLSTGPLQIRSLTIKNHKKP